MVLTTVDREPTVAVDAMSARGTRHGWGTLVDRTADRMLAALIAGLSFLADRTTRDRAVETGAGLGRLWVRLGGPRTRRVEQQLEASFPAESREQIERWTRGVFEHLGRGLAELVVLRGRHREALLDCIDIDGLEHLEAAEKASASGGVLVVTAHYGNWELAGLRVATLGLPMSAVFRGFSQPTLDRTLLDLRTANGSAKLDYEQIRMGRAGLGLQRALRSGRKVLVLLDQNARRNEGCFVPFFGRPACVRTGPIRLSLRAGVPIVPAFTRRDPSGTAHRVVIHPALDLEPAAGAGSGARRSRSDATDRVADLAARLTALIEAEIRADPTQWIWTHRRWRTQPPAEMGAAEPDSACPRGRS